MNTQTDPIAELSPRERGFARRIMSKYPGGVSREKDLFRSMAIFSSIVVVFHLIEVFVPTNWLALLIVYPPAIWMFSRYRKFSIFRSCLISKLTARLAQFDPQFEPTEQADSGSSPPGHAHPRH